MLKGERSGILFYGDPHSDFEPLIVAAEETRPAAVVLLGDCDLRRPLKEELATLFAGGIELAWILGNHETDNHHWYDHLTASHPGGNLHGRIVELSSFQVLGIGGVFRTRVWDPRQPATMARFRAPDDLLKTVPKGDRWRDGLPLRHRSTIFPSDIAISTSLKADILVTHEAPTTHPLGWAALDDLAKSTGARLIVHGHHHVSSTGTLPSGIKVRGLAIAEPWYLSPRDGI